MPILFFVIKNVFIVNYDLSVKDISTTTTSKMELFVAIVNGFRLLTNATKNSILDGARVLDTLLNSNTFFLLLFKSFKISLSRLVFQCRTEC